jgi:hypothetical protein
LALAASILGVTTGGAACDQEVWQVVLGEAHVGDEAVRVVLEDLREFGAPLGLSFEVGVDSAEIGDGNTILLGDAARNAQTAALVAEKSLTLGALDHAEGYAISTLKQEAGRTIVVAGGSVIGDVYGLYWLWDRMQVKRRIPDIQVVRVPAVDIRLGAAWGRKAFGGHDESQMRIALRHSFNWVAGPAILDLVPWDSEPESSANRLNREAVRPLIDYAHSLHMKYFSFANEFTFHPSLLEQHDATLTPCDPKFWDAVQGKFRGLFSALPELDGIELCNDDISGFWEGYEPFDVTRDAPDCEWSYEKRFRTFVNKVHEVVAGEFDKTYFHFTWGLREHEVHCQPEVFRRIFEDVPVNNLYLMPKITRGDRWWHQPYNATFNQTAHETVVLFETMNYYESGASNLFPTFSGEYFQRGLQSLMATPDTNVRGMAALAGLARRDWGTVSAYGYVLYRLMWNPYDSMEDIARDFCAIHLDPAFAEELAEIYLLTPSAYKYGLHIEPISYGQFNSFLHMRVGTFPADGYPVVDGGKEHLAFLQRIYLRCAPWKAETLRAMEHGRATAERMTALFAEIRGRMSDTALAVQLENRLQMTLKLIGVNIAYVENIFAYFDYVESPLLVHRDALASAYERLLGAIAEFRAVPGFNYDLFGVIVLQQNVEDVLNDREGALDRLAKTPNRREIEGLIAAQQQQYQELLEAHGGEAVLFGRFEILVDGQDILIVNGDSFDIKNVRWDGAHVAVGELVLPLPREPFTVIPLDIESRPMHPFVIEQPSADNDFTAQIYLDDAPGANGWMKFDLYYISKPPESLGLTMPWARKTG